MFACSEGGGKAMASAITVIETAKLDNVDQQAWLTWLLSQIADLKITRFDELLLGIALIKQRKSCFPSRQVGFKGQARRGGRG
ncbi:transposase domain-containing protein [Pontivivens insulae]|uniref:Transposase IS66 C-terminal domain-containing protein n=1 Tax=Pontivivens insulae TaxID=1639689 RepID=A0A2R8AGJ1_9RHOB|nr:transposase domain-containing protein [Pontivivens insulae]SPF31190.1 hypothetical protein POI8812_03541 [Pontivivens insulae]